MDSVHEQDGEVEMPPTKRQRTQSPQPLSAPNHNHHMPAAAPLHTPALGVDEVAPAAHFREESQPDDVTKSIPGLGAVDVPTYPTLRTEESGDLSESNAILDVLMQHVESTASPPAIYGHGETTISKDEFGNIDITGDNGHNFATISAEIHHDSPEHLVSAFLKKNESHDSSVAAQDKDPLRAGEDVAMSLEAKASAAATTTTDQTDVQQSTVAPQASDDLANRNQAPADGNIEGVANLVGTAIAAPISETPETTGAPEEAEWEVDSSPLNSSSDSDSSSDTSSSDESDDEDEDAGGYSLLGLEEQARILMQGDGGSDDEGGSKSNNVTQLRTTNEKPEEIIPKPDITVTDDMKVVELGSVEGVVENTVLVKAKISGEYQVLESGSLLCLADKTVVGVVAETLGRVEQPMYTIRFTNQTAVEEAGLSALGTTVHYVEPHSKFVFTQPLKGIKGSDASNFHDEEVGDEEKEFSDDEQEAEHKRQQKLKRQGRTNERGGRGGRGAYRDDRRLPSVTHTHDQTNGSAYSSGAIEMNYDDIQDGADEGYTPLKRPYDMTMQGEQQSAPKWTKGSPESSSNGPGMSPLNRFPGGSRGRGRGGRASRGGRGGRGNMSQDYTAPTNHPVPPRPAQQYQYQQPFQSPQPSNQPIIPPQYPGYSPFSPLSPLPGTQYQQFGNQPAFNPHAYHQNSVFSMQPQPPQTQQMPPPGSYVNPALMAALVAHQQQQPQFNGQANYRPNPEDSTKPAGR